MNASCFATMLWAPFCAPCIRSEADVEQCIECLGFGKLLSTIAAFSNMADVNRKQLIIAVSEPQFLDGLGLHA